MDTVMNRHLLKIIEGLLGRERILSNKLGGRISTTMGVDDPLEGLTAERLQGLEEYELELLLAPLFTPTMDDQIACEAALPLTGFPTGGQETLVAQLLAAHIRCDLVFGDGRQPLSPPEVVVERFVRLLRLDGVVDQAVAAYFETLDAAARHRCLCLARRRVWRSPERAALLRRCLEIMRDKNSFDPERFDFLSCFVHTYHPVGVSGLVTALENLMESYHRDHEHPIFNERLEEHQGGNIRSRYCGPEVKALRVRMARSFLVDFDKQPQP